MVRTFARPVAVLSLLMVGAVSGLGAGCGSGKATSVPDGDASASATGGGRGGGAGGAPGGAAGEGAGGAGAGGTGGAWFDDPNGPEACLTGGCPAGQFCAYVIWNGVVNVDRCLPAPDNCSTCECAQAALAAYYHSRFPPPQGLPLGCACRGTDGQRIDGGTATPATVSCSGA